ncbi:4-amino-4-deoxy-L-arabinose transferase [Halovenus aranensis]|uniref:4-amino-4-deoxy-L-arabinose transferase n=1 Tax=Halovenus aranensis TaxID=890420 RepID=A0A1G8VTL7_9EURY|nr:4-amino-4-deoxy-L-arabinose transferase [Halovenus aranensis]
MSPEAVAAGGLAVLTGVAVFALASTVFEYHSSNHDEAVYLQQAAMLLEGKLELAAGDLVGAFRPWFFVEDGGTLYPKYAPVPAAMYAISMALFGEPRVTLAAIAAANTGLVYILGAAVADRRVGLVAAALFACSPMAFVTSATFLPYAPTTLCNLVFAVAYLRGVRTGGYRWGAVAGLAIGIAFFARPYTAVLFALPFVAHAAYTALACLADEGYWPLPTTARRQLLTALCGLCFVLVTLCYNARLTGDPLTFPYAAFAPLDGPGFGYRRILDHAIEYTPGVAVRANGFAVWYLLSRWVVAGLLGAGLALGGIAVVVRAWQREGDSLVDPTAGLLVAAVVPSVVLGNVPFWGNYNLLATLSDPTDGLVSQFGPFYHFDLLAPVAVFAAVALVVGWRRLSSRLAAHGPVSPRRLALSGLLVSVLVLAGTSAVLAATPVDRNAAYAEKYDTAYGPVEAADFENDLVFVPTPYGEWQAHPFQVLRNDPGFDGPVVYALDRDPAEDFAVIDAYPDRSLHRYTYRGEWSADASEHVLPRLESLSVRRAAAFDAEAVVGVPDRVDRAHVRLTTQGGGPVEYTVDDPDTELTVPWSLDGNNASLDEAAGAVALDETDLVVVTVTLVQPDGSTLTYRQEATVRADGDAVEVVWPPERTVCRLTTACGREGTYLPDHPGEHLGGVSFRVSLDPE